ncbi:peptidase S28 [Neoconidiobolus thromboides FSU 785]|nr:peptidase S28 [Neoconidiobolus thromboides FSU 785]
MLNKFRIFRSGEETTEYWFDQILTHDDTPDSNITWQQRYFINDQFYQPGGPAFLFIGGESELSGSWAQNSLLSKAAEEHKGVVYALEHRFYGKSYPKSDLTLDSLKYLTSDLAIDDLAYFAKNIQLPQSNTTTNDITTKWILYGGSYPGNLSAWARKKHSDIFHAAIASSAPVEAKENFYEYDLQVQRSLGENGGQECLNYYLENFKAIDEILFSGDEIRINALKESFTCADVDNRYFATALNYFAGLVQDNDNNNLKVAKHCKTLYLNGTMTEKLNDFALSFKNALGSSSCTTFTNYSYYNNTRQPSPKEFSRQWLYQSCNEFGYWQVAPPKDFPAARSRLLDVDFNREAYCSGIFGPEGPKSPKIDETNRKYLGKNIQTDRLLFVNGELDPWTPLSITDPTDKIPTIVIEGAAHCADLAYPDSSDTQYVAEAKDKILGFIRDMMKLST